MTGGAGFIGSNLVRLLLREREDAEVVTLDALTYAGHLESLVGPLDDEMHRFVHGDICDVDVVQDVMRDVDVVFHLAAESHVDRSILADAPFVRTNVMGTAVLLAAAQARGVRRFVHVSTDEVYGELPWLDPAAGATDDGAAKFTEDTPLAPRSPYSATKAASDHLVHAYFATHELDAVITRCSNNYGPHQFPEKLIPVLIDRALRDQPLPVYGDGLHIRDWIDVEDHCRGLLRAADQGVAGRVYNFGGGAERTNLSVARAVLDELDKPDSLIDFVEDRPGHDRRYAVDYERASSELGWEPATRFGEGLGRTVAWYVENRAWCDAVTAAAGKRGRAGRGASRPSG